MTRNGAKFEKKKIYYHLLFASFLLSLRFLSKHLEEPVKPAAKRITSLTAFHQKAAHLIKENTKSSTATSTEDHKTDAKDENKDQASPSVQGTNQKTNNQTPHQDGNQEKSKPAERRTRLGRTRRWLLCH